MEITQIIAVDKACREQLAQAKEKAENIDREIPARVQAERGKIEAAGRQEVAAFAEQQKQTVERRAAESAEAYQKQRQQLDDRYAQMGEDWVKTIVAAVTGEDS